MSTYPQTLTEARLTRYGKSRKDPGDKYREGYCAAPVRGWSVSGWSIWRYVQCKEKNGHGPEGLYCELHATKVS